MDSSRSSVISARARQRSAVARHRGGAAAFVSARSCCWRATRPAVSADQQQNDGDREDHPQAADQPGLGLRAHLLGPPFGVFSAFGGIEEGDLGGGGPGVGALAPVQRLGEPHASVELAVRAAEGVPRVGGGGEVLDGCAGLPCPRPARSAAAARRAPGPRVRSPRRRCHWSPAGSRPRGRSVAGVRAPPRTAVEAPARARVRPGCRSSPVSAPGRAARPAAPGPILAYTPSRGLGDRATDPARGRVALDGQRVRLAPLPSLQQGV